MMREMDGVPSNEVCETLNISEANLWVMLHRDRMALRQDCETTFFHGKGGVNAVIEPTNWWKTKVVMFIATHTPKCHDITRLISQSLDRPLPLRTRLAMWIHYRICVWCERYRDQLGFMGKALKSCPERDVEERRDGLSPEARTRLKVAVKPTP